MAKKKQKPKVYLVYIEVNEWGDPELVGVFEDEDMAEAAADKIREEYAKDHVVFGHNDGEDEWEFDIHVEAVELVPTLKEKK